MKLLSNVNEFSKRKEELNSSKLGVVKIVPGQKTRFMVVPYQGTDAPFIFMQETHEVFNEKYGYYVQVPCLKEHVRYKKDANGNVMVDAEGNPILDRDPVTGRPLNDGTCPYCEVAKMEKQLASHKIRKYFEMNPNATKEQYSPIVKDIYSRVYVKDKLRLTAGIVVAVIKTDATGEEPVFDDKGKIQFRLAVMKLTETQFEDKLKLAFEEAGQILGQEFTLNVPNKVDKTGAPDVKEAAKSMTFSPKFKNLFVDKDPTLWERIKEEAKKITLDMVENEVASFKKETVIEAQAKLAGRKSVLNAELTSGEKKLLAEGLAQPLANVSDYVSVESEPAVNSVNPIDEVSAENFLDALQAELDIL